MHRSRIEQPKEPSDDKPSDEVLLGKLKAALEKGPFWFALYDSDRVLSYCSSSYLSNLSPELRSKIENRGRSGVTWQDIVDDRFRMMEGHEDLAAEAQKRLMTGKAPPSAKLEVSDGPNMVRRLQVTDIGNGDHVVFGLPINELKAREAALEKAKVSTGQARALLDQSIEAIDSVFALYDANRILITCNEAYRQMFGQFSAEVVPGVTLYRVVELNARFKSDTDTNETEKDWVDRIFKHVSTGGNVREMVTEDGRTIRMTRSEVGAGNLVITGLDITDLKKTQNELAEKAAALSKMSNTNAMQAKCDPLTGIYNRRGWQDYAEQEYEAARYRDQALAVMHLDLDDFKIVNDTYGHMAGDAVLLEITCRIQSVLTFDHVLARIGGDEFMIAIITPEGSTLPHEIAKDIVQLASEPVSFDGILIQVGMSIGMAIGSGEGASLHQLQLDSDVALYRAKAEGRNQCCLFNDQMREAHQRERTLSFDLGQAISNGDMAAYFQPKVCATTHKIFGVEALARWHHPTLGILAPPHFLALAETRKLTGELDRLILEKALEAQRSWSDQGLGCLPVAVNVSARRLSDPMLLKSLDGLNIEPGTVTFELLETTFLDDLDTQLSRNLDGLREMGIGLDIDDFGTGHASLASTMRVRPDFVKIDRSLVIDIQDKPESQKLVSLIVAMANVLDVGTIAEGVEDADVARLLKSLGCKGLQGYYFGKPMKTQDFAAQLEAATASHQQKRAG